MTATTGGGRDARPAVLVVDDFDDTRELLRHFLEAGGHRVVEAVNGRDAIEVAGREMPALVLMDLNMPVLDGFTATLRLRENALTRHVPVVAVTAHDTPEFRAAADAVGCDEYLVKPVDFDNLSRLVKIFLPEAIAGAGGDATL